MTTPTNQMENKTMKEITFLDGTIRIKSFGKGGRIETDLERETCPFCGSSDCCFSCDGSVSHFEKEEDKTESEEEVATRIKFNGALDGIESLLLSLCSADLLKSEDPKVNEALQTTLDAIANND
jgi:hypothetical protein